MRVRVRVKGEGEGEGEGEQHLGLEHRQRLGRTLLVPMLRLKVLHHVNRLPPQLVPG